jgi:hypothetical protein
VSVVAVSVRRMIIDCDTCTVRGAACADCVVTFLTIPVRAAVGPPGRPTSAEPSRPRVDRPAGPVPVGAPGDAQPRPVELDAAEREAIGVLAASGLVPPLRMVRAV